MNNFEILYRSGMMSKQIIRGTPPLTFTSDGSPLVDYTIHGATGGVGDKTENLFYKTAEMDVSTNWIGGKYYPERPDSQCYFIFFSLPAEVKTILKSESNISAKVFQKGSYFNGMVFAITPEIIGSVSTEYRILQKNGEVLDFTQNMSEWDDIYLSIGYGQGIIVPASGVDRRKQIIEAFFNNFDLSIISGATMPETYEPYGYKIPITCGGETTNIYLDSLLYEGDSISLSTAGVEIPTIEGENTLTVGTTVQPSAVEIKAVKSAALSKADRYFQYLYDVARSRR